MQPDAAFLFAAGLGTRMMPLTRTRPKPLVEVAGSPLFDHALARVKGCETLVANTHYMAPMMAAHLAKRGVIRSHEPELLDTGGGLKQGLVHIVGDSVITINTDAVWSGGEPIATLTHEWNPDAMDALLVLVPRENALGHVGKGDFSMDARGRIVPGRDFIYSGLQRVPTAPFREETDQAFPMARMWAQFLAKKRMFGSIFEGAWCDVGRPESIPLANEMLARADV